ncbi:MAG TPA: YcxB family protein [Pyrinomonadaceae bacterium]|nr:YcxB family protein [Pyrinomonadaceae bacterium]
MEAITVHYKLSEKEYLDAARLILFPKPVEWRLRAATACMLLPMAFFLSAVAVGFEPLPALGVAVALLPLVVYLIFFHFNAIARRCYKGDRRFREAMTLTFTDEHITLQSKLVESKQSWKLYTDVLEGETCYALIYGQDIRMAIMLPKRAFRTKQQHRAFRELVGAQFKRALPLQRIGELEAEEREYHPASLEPPDWR